MQHFLVMWGLLAEEPNLVGTLNIKWMGMTFPRFYQFETIWMCLVESLCEWRIIRIHLRSVPVSRPHGVALKGAFQMPFSVVSHLVVEKVMKHHFRSIHYVSVAMTFRLAIEVWTPSATAYNRTWSSSHLPVGERICSTRYSGSSCTPSNVLRIHVLGVAF